MSRVWRGWLMCVAALTAGSCAQSGGQTRKDDVPQIGLQRGGRWSVVSVRPPHLTGPHFHLLLKNGVLSGSIAGGTAPAGNLRVEIAEDGADGYGPLGPVSMEFITTEQSTVAEGMWNGHRVHLVFARDSIKGTVADNSDVVTRGDPDAQQGMQTFRGRRGRGGSSVTPNQIDPLPGNSSCEYFLTEIAPDGALTGGSICSGMPQPTRLEVPSVAQGFLRRHELVTLLVAVLSAPPAVAAEELGPRFDSSPPTPPPAPVIRGR